VFRIIKRSPWIALGAAGAWFLDPAQGPQRRAMITSKAKQWKDELTSSRSTTPVGEPFANAPGSTRPGEFADPALAQRSA
jgi:hypothetical protein